MLLTATETHVAVPSTVVLILIGSTVFGLGYAVAVMKRARKDYRTTKAAVPALRKSFWLAVMSMLKVGVVVGICVIVLIVWAWREIRGNSDGAGTGVKPSPSVSSSGHAPARHPNR
jgi:hypothetical protein